MLRSLLLSAMLVTIASAAHAEISAREFLQKYDAAGPNDKAIFELVLGGNHNGIAWNQSMLKAEKTICAPEKLPVENAQVIAIMRQGIKAMPKLADNPYGIALFRSLEHVFPCPAR